MHVIAVAPAYPCACNLRDENGELTKVGIATVLARVDMTARGRSCLHSSIFHDHEERHGASLDFLITCIWLQGVDVRATVFVCGGQTRALPVTISPGLKEYTGCCHHNEAGTMPRTGERSSMGTYASGTDSDPRNQDSP